MVYIVFFENGRFVDYDKIEELIRKIRKRIDRKEISILNKLTEYSELNRVYAQLKRNSRFD